MLSDPYYEASLVDSNNYLLACMRYIELNPVRAGMTEVPGEYPWSSYHANGYDKEDARITPHPLYLELGRNRDERTHAYRELFINRLNYDQIHDIREALNQELILGNSDFKEQIEAMTDRRTVPGNPGRPKISEAGGYYYVY